MPAIVTESPSGWCIGGELDAASTGRLESAFSRLPESDDGRVEIDLRAVDFIDSSGLHALIALHHRVTTAGRVLVLRNPSRSVTRLLAITKLDDMFAIDGAGDDTVRWPT